MAMKSMALKAACPHRWSSATAVLWPYDATAVVLTMLLTLWLESNISTSPRGAAWLAELPSCGMPRVIFEVHRAEMSC